MCFFALASTGARAGKTVGALAASAAALAEVDAPLSGPAINGVTPTGRARYEVESDRREFEAEVENVNLPQGTALRVLVDGAQVGAFSLDGDGRARLRLRTDEGQAVPVIVAGSRVAVANQAGATLLAGAFSSAPDPSPSPTPGASPSPSPDATPGASPSPTPGATPSPTPGATPSPTPGASPSPTPGATPVPTPGEFEIEAPLTGAPINGVTPSGRARHEIEFGHREFEVEVRDVNLPQGTVLRIFVDGAQVVTLALDDQQRGRVRLRTDEGQTVPEITSRTRVVVTNQAGATLLAGAFSSVTPTPTPTPGPTPGASPSPTPGATPGPTPGASPSPTPGATPGPSPTPGSETRVEAMLAGAPINGLTPKGEAEFRLRDDGRRELRVEIEKVNLPAGTVLNVLVNNVLAGQITLNSQLEGELELDTEDGQLVPQFVTGAPIVVTNQAGATVLSSTFNRPVAVITAANDIDDAAFFVEKHYHDFLDREPDDSGLAFWKNQITQCGADAGCIDRARANTSGAFFLSIEFQQTGFLLYRLNRASFGVKPLRVEFLVDMQRAAQGVVVGRTGWEQVLESNTRALIADWVSRAAFRAVFDPLTNAQYVDALFQRAGVTPSPAERDALVAGLDTGAETRATVLRKVAENAVFARQEKNPAFVLMQYFGYLHRDPDEAGFNFWLQKLNNHGGDFHAAEMVRSFILAGEYRDRFKW